MIMGKSDKIELWIDFSKQRVLELGNAIPVPNNDYNPLKNKPSINGITLSGDKTLTELMYDGLIIDGGDATSTP